MTTLLKLSSGFSVLLPSIGVVLGYIIFFSFLLKIIDMSVVYAIWEVFGMLLVNSTIGMVFFYESVCILKIASILLILLEAVGLMLAN